MLCGYGPAHPATSAKAAQDFGVEKLSLLCDSAGRDGPMGL